MKRLLRLLPLSLPLFLAPLLFHAHPTQSIETLAASSSYAKATLPTTIDLNPVEESEVRSYYGGLNGKSGNELLKALKPILMTGQKYWNYDTGGTDIWQMYEIIDRDWGLSPASSTTYGTYDSGSNTITNYEYGTSKDAKNNPYLHVLYRDHSAEAGRIRAWDDHTGYNAFNREHVWPKSRGFSLKSDGQTEATDSGARGDPHHLIAGDCYVNTVTHNNYAYGYVDPAKITSNPASQTYNDVQVLTGNYRGISATFGQSLGETAVFEPIDSDKGDIARACFYMVARYNNLAGDDDTIDAGNPNLGLEDTVDTATIAPRSDANNPVTLGLLTDLLAWHKQDPVDAYEIHRNDLIHRNYGGNRNPFIDFPEWVDYIWGTAEYDENNHKAMNRNTSPTGSVNLSSDVFHGYRVPGEEPESSSSGSSSPASSSSSSSSSSESTMRYLKKTTMLQEGDQITFVKQGAGKVDLFDVIFSGFYNNDYGTYDEVSIENETVVVDSPYLFTVESTGTENQWYFKTNDTAKYMYCTNDNNVKAGNKADNAKWNVSFSQNGASIVTNKEHSTRYLQWLDDSRYYRFACYATSQKPIQIYKVVSQAEMNHFAEATPWASDFLSTYTAGCNADGGYNDALMDWTGAAEGFAELSSAAQAYIRDYGLDYTTLGNALRRYDYIIGKYSSTTFADFMSRSQGSKMNLPIAQQNESIVPTLLVLIMASLGCVSCFLYFKSRRKGE